MFVSAMAGAGIPFFEKEGLAPGKGRPSWALVYLLCAIATVIATIGMVYHRCHSRARMDIKKKTSKREYGTE